MNSYDVAASRRDADVSLEKTDLRVLLVSFLLPLAKQQGIN
jgi:hypothetical protein